MRREIPLFLTFLFGAFFVTMNFFATDRVNFLTEPVNDWMSIIIAFTYVLGVGNVLRIHGKKIAARQEGWVYSAATVAGLAVMLLYGLVFWIPMGMAYSGQPPTTEPGQEWMTGMQTGSVFNWFYDAVYTPMQSTMFGMLAFFISSAAFRAFRVRSVQAALLAVTAMILILGGVPLGEKVWSAFPEFTSWVMEILQTAGKRAILIGAALGAISTGVKIILGIEKSYLGGQ
jgi:hypothetical protein